MMLLRTESCIVISGKAMTRKIIEIHNNGDEIGFWFEAGLGSNKICLGRGLAETSIVCFPLKNNNIQNTADEYSCGRG